MLSLALSMLVYMSYSKLTTYLGLSIDSGAFRLHQNPNIVIRHCGVLGSISDRHLGSDLSTIGTVPPCRRIALYGCTVLCGALRYC